VLGLNDVSLVGGDSAIAMVGYFHAGMCCRLTFRRMHGAILKGKTRGCIDAISDSRCPPRQESKIQASLYLGPFFPCTCGGLFAAPA